MSRIHFKPLGNYTFNAEDDWGDYKDGISRIAKRNKDGYAVHRYLCEDGVSHKIGEHIAKWEYFNGEIPEGLVIDHIIPIRNGGTNKLSNLRLVTPKGNANNELTKQNLSKSLTGVIHTEEWNKKIGDANKGKKRSEEDKKRMSDRMSGKNHPNWGKHLSEETRQKISEANKGKHLSEEARQKISKTKKGKYVGENNWHYGKKLSDEHKTKLSDAKKGKLSNRRIEVVQLTSDYEFVAEHKSGTVVGFCQSAISNCCRGKQKKHKDFIWMWKSDYEKMLEKELES